MRRVWFVTVGLVAALTSTVIALVAAELIVRVVVPPETFQVVQNVYQASQIPGVGYTMVPNFDGIAFGVPLSTTPLGFRGPARPEAKPANTFRIVLIGDSHAFGFGVAQGETTDVALEARLNQAFEGDYVYEVLNFAIPGHNAVQEAAVFHQVALAFDPDVAILVPCHNDHEPATVAGQDHWLEIAPADGAPASPESSWRRTVRGWLLHSRLYLYARLSWVRREEAARQADARKVPSEGRWLGPILPGHIPQMLQDEVGAPLRGIIATARGRGTSIVMAPLVGPQEYRRLFQQLAREADAPLVEWLTLFPEANDWEDLLARFGLGWDPHLGPVAQERFAAALFETLVAHGMLPEEGAPQVSSGDP